MVLETRAMIACERTLCRAENMGISRARLQNESGPWNSEPTTHRSFQILNAKLRGVTA